MGFAKNIVPSESSLSIFSMNIFISSFSKSLKFVLKQSKFSSKKSFGFSISIVTIPDILVVLNPNFSNNF
jgi:hypothetical protein